MNMANIHYDVFSLGFEETCVQINEIINGKLNEIKEVLKNKFYRSELPIVEKFLLNLLKIFKVKIRAKEITRTSEKTWFNNFVPEMITKFRSNINSRIDMELLDLKFAWVLSDFYKKSDNLEKAYFVLKRAFSDNMSSVEIIVDNYIMIFKVRPLVCGFIGA